jgi:hypothetical protein
MLAVGCDARPRQGPGFRLQQEHQVSAEQWKVGSSAGACASCAKVLGPGDTRLSALYDEQDGQGEQAALVRHDYCADCWSVKQGGGEFSFWRTVIPEPEEEEDGKRKLSRLIDTDTLLDILRDTPDSADPQKMRFRFVISLMLMRRKKLKLVSIGRRPAPDGSGPRDVLVLRMAGKGQKQTLDIADVKMSEEEMISAQDEIGTLIGMGGVGAPAEGDSDGGDGEAPEGEEDHSRGPAGGDTGSPECAGDT